MIQNESHHLRLGTKLNNRYVIQGVLGEGGFGITYVGVDEVLCQKVAIKEFFPDGMIMRNNQQTNEIIVSYGTKAESFRKGEENFLQEARTLAQFNNVRGVVRVQDFFRENGTAYIVMEYLEGMTLKQYLQNYGTLTVEEMQGIFAPILETLDKIHQRGVIHRDISPDNIMCLPGGEVKLMDFGAARGYTDFGEKSLSVILKIGFAPIEQYNSHGKQGPWTDIYALGATMYQCITGKKPDDAAQRSVADTLIPPSQLGVRIAPNVEDALMTALQVRPGDRYRNLGEFCKDLYSVTSDKSVSINMNTFRQTTASYDWGTPDGTKSRNGEEAKYIDTSSKRPNQSKKSATPLLIGICCTLTVAICLGIGTIIFQNMNMNKTKVAKSTAATTEITKSTEGTTTAATTESTQASTTQQQSSVSVPQTTTQDTVDTQSAESGEQTEIFEDDSALADYSNCLDLDNYTYMESPDGDYTFYYPENVYNYAYSEGDSCIFTSDDEKDTVKFIRKENTSGSPAQGMENMYNSYTQLSEKEQILFREKTDDRGFARGVLAGIGEEQNVYASIAANEDYVYIMEVCSSFQHDATKSSWVEYYIDCMYRYCSFSRKVGDPRSYDEYMAGND